ncbi:hypothetical protein JCM10049v2_003611 [Rhodotorula toruloides]
MAIRAPLRLLRPSRPTQRLVARGHTLKPPSSAVRFASTHAGHQQPSKGGIRVAHVFGTLALIGIGATSYGLWQFYGSFTAYPDTASHPVRSKLRSALRAQSTGEHESSSTLFEAAYSLALDLFHTGELGKTQEEAVMRLTGIAVRWGAMWEEAGELSKAIAAYDTGFQPIAALIDGFKVGEGAQPSVEEVKRGAGIAMKLGDLWIRLGGAEGTSEAERYYTWALQELMRLNMTDKQKQRVKDEMASQDAPVPAAGPQASTKKGEIKDDETLQLPEWLNDVEVVAAMERLGDLYSRMGKIEFAQPLLQQAIAILLPPPPKEGPRPAPPPIGNRCHAATLMNNLSSALVAAPSPSQQAIEASARWARQSLTIANGCRKEADAQRGGKDVPLVEREERECELTAIVSSYNLGKLSEMSKDPISAEQWFVRSGKHAASLGLRDAARQANEAIRRLKHPSGPPA